MGPFSLTDGPNAYYYHQDTTSVIGLLNRLKVEELGGCRSIAEGGHSPQKPNPTSTRQIACKLQRTLDFSGVVPLPPEENAGGKCGVLHERTWIILTFGTALVEPGKPLTPEESSSSAACQLHCSSFEIIVLVST